MYSRQIKKKHIKNSIIAFIVQYKFWIIDYNFPENNLKKHGIDLFSSAKLHRLKKVFKISNN